MQPNGEMIHYPFPTTINYMQAQGMPITTRQPSTSTQTPQHLPTITSLSSKSHQSTTAAILRTTNEPNAKPNVSCFNCGSATHTGADCPDIPMVDSTRSNYKLDYNAMNVSDAVTTNVSSSESVDNGNSGVKGSNESITQIPSSVLNK